MSEEYEKYKKLLRKRIQFKKNNDEFAIEELAKKLCELAWAYKGRKDDDSEFGGGEEA